MKISSLIIKILQPNKYPRKQRKFRLLLDAAFPKIGQLPKLKAKAHLEHVVYTLNMSRKAEDEFIYQKATQENCCVVSIDEDFKWLAKPKQAGAIIVPADLSVKQLETILIKFISGKNPDDFLGKAVKI